MDSAAEIFAANRARGLVRLRLAAAAGETRPVLVREEGALRVRFPHAVARDAEAVIVNSAGGLAGGDACTLDLALDADAGLTVTTAAAEKVYRALGPPAQVAVRLAAGPRARLAWLPQETILFDRARLARCIDVELAEDASLVVAEALVFGRAAHGETVRQGFLSDRWRVRRGGRLVFAETVRLDGAVAARMAARAVAAGGVALATVLAVPGDETLAERLRAAVPAWRGEVGISAWNGLCAARFCAQDAAALRADLIAVLAALGAPLPRIWLN